MTHHFAAATAAVADPAVQRRQREAARSRAGDKRMKAPTTAIDLDDVARLDPL
jgi:hypothetical protein